MKNLLMFIGGAIIGAGATYLYQKNRYEEMIQEEVESLREHMREKEPKDKQGITKDQCEEYKKDEDHKEIKRNEEDLERAEVIITTNSYNSAFNDHKNNMVSKFDKPFVVTPEEFASIPGFDTDTFYYHHDDIISNENQEMVDNIENILGLSISEIKEQFGIYEDDAVYIRNMTLKCDYEILREESDFIGRNGD